MQIQNNLNNLIISQIGFEKNAKQIQKIILK